MLTINDIKEKLAFIQAQYPQGMHPALTEPEVQAYESAIGTRLPEDIRLFVTQIGNGGVGPFGGLNRGLNELGWYKLQYDMPFDPAIYAQVEKYSPEVFRQRQKDELFRILQTYGTYKKVASPNRYQKDIKTFWGIDLAEDEYVEFSAPTGCIPIYHCSSSSGPMYLIVHAPPAYYGQVLGSPCVGERGGLPRLWGGFEAFYGEWLEGEVRRGLNQVPSRL